jgi:hypothetical protein
MVAPVTSRPDMGDDPTRQRLRPRRPFWRWVVLAVLIAVAVWYFMIR